MFKYEKEGRFYLGVAKFESFNGKITCKLNEYVDQVLDALKIFYWAHGVAVKGLTDRNGHRQQVVRGGKSGRQGGTWSKFEERECDLDQKMLLHSYLLKLCLKQNLVLSGSARPNWLK